MARTGIQGGAAPSDTSGLVAKTGSTSTGEQVAPSFKASGKTGATAVSPILAGGTTSGAPVSGAHLQGELVTDDTGKLWYCTTAGTPGTWVEVGKSKRIEPPYTFNPGTYQSTTDVGSVNRAHYLRIQNNPGTATITKLGIYVGTSSGNICVAVLRGANGISGPTSRIATSGSVACPAIGYAEVSLGGSVAIDPLTDWFAISADNTTAKFGRVGNPGLLGAAFGAGLNYYEPSAFPVPSPPTPTVGAVTSFLIVGIA